MELLLIAIGTPARGDCCLNKIFLSLGKISIMKRIILSVLFCFPALFMQSQPTLLSSEMLPFEATMNFKYIIDYWDIDTTIQGQGVTWNFSSLLENTSSQGFSVTIVNPSTTPYYSYFTSSNYGYREVYPSSTSYRYFNLTPTKMERLGSFITSANIYSNPQVEYVFPLAYNTENYDTWHNSISTFDGNYDIKCIGTGTLISPSGSYNALMVRVHQTQLPLIDYYIYFWYSSDNGAVLLEYIVGDDKLISPSAMFLNSLVNSVDENSNVDDVTYMNPVNDIFRFGFQSSVRSEYSYSVVNYLGQTVLEGTAETNPDDRCSLELDFNSLPKGIYFFNIRVSDNASKTFKIIKD